jgi:prolipoprotein diacylglyceryltransferase
MPALYDLFSVTALLVVLLLLRRRARWDGFLVSVFAAWYGAGRFVEDFFRIDDNVALGLSGSQLTALTLTTGACLWLVFAHRTPGWSPIRSAPEPEPEPEPEPKPEIEPELDHEIESESSEATATDR